MSFRSKALACLRNQRVVITHAGVVLDDRPTFIEASVYSAREERRTPYRVILHADSPWTCTCHQGEGCAHIAAVCMVTGWPSAAALERAS